MSLRNVRNPYFSIILTPRQDIIFVDVTQYSSSLFSILQVPVPFWAFVRVFLITSLVGDLWATKSLHNLHTAFSSSQVLYCHMPRVASEVLLLAWCIHFPSSRRISPFRILSKVPCLLVPLSDSWAPWAGTSFLLSPEVLWVRHRSGVCTVRAAAGRPWFSAWSMTLPPWRLTRCCPQLSSSLSNWGPGTKHQQTSLFFCF